MWLDALGKKRKTIYKQLWTKGSSVMIGISSVSIFIPSPQNILSTQICVPLRLSAFFSSHVSISLITFFSSPGVSSDPALHPDLYPCWSYEADHSAGSEPSAAAVWTEELRVHLPHPGQHAQRPGSEVQQQQHTMSEDHGKAQEAWKLCSEITAAYRDGNTLQCLFKGMQWFWADICVFFVVVALHFVFCQFLICQYLPARPISADTDILSINWCIPLCWPDKYEFMCWIRPC